MKDLIKRILSKTNYRISKFDKDYITYPFAQTNEGILTNLLSENKISITFDVGANVGQWANDLRISGYKHRIISFEPLQKAFKILSSTCLLDDLWSSHNYGLGDTDGVSEINVSRNSVSSSLLPMSKTHLEAEPKSSFYSTEKIKVHKLDTIYAKFIKDSDNVFLKIDTQGFEKKVLDGANSLLKRTAILQLELSFQSLYDGENDFFHMKSILEKLGFLLYHIQDGFRHSQTKELLQVDAIFINKACNNKKNNF